MPSTDLQLAFIHSTLYLFIVPLRTYSSISEPPHKIPETVFPVCKNLGCQMITLNWEARWVQGLPALHTAQVPGAAQS